jgi:predicted phosphoadenosine phosphosulfate sulfurtransferase
MRGENMAIKRCESSIDVVKAAKIRIRNVFQNGLPVYMSFSGGKDSLCMAQLVMELVQAGEIFRLSDFSKEDFLNMMIKPNQGYSKAEFITKI